MMQSLSCDGVNVNYLEMQPEENSDRKLTVLFLHNAGTDHSIWLDVAKIVSKKFHCILLDWPGYGVQRGLVKGHGLGDYAEVLASFIQLKSLDSVVLVGNCLGSGASLEYCRRQGGKGIELNILFNVLVPKTLGGMGRFFYRWSNSSLNGLYHTVRKALYTPHLISSLPVTYQLSDRSRVPKHCIQHLRALNEDSTNIGNLGLLVEALVKSKDLDELEMPAYFPKTVVVWGDKNRVLPWRCGRKFVEQFKPTQYQVLEGGHLVMLEHPKQCAELIWNTINDSKRHSTNSQDLSEATV